MSAGDGGPGPVAGRPDFAAPVRFRQGAADTVRQSPEGREEPARADGENQRLRAATRDFEAVFIQQMMKAMRDTVPDGGLLDAGASEDIFSSLLDQHLAGLTAGEESDGLADALYRQFVEGAER